MNKVINKIAKQTDCAASGSAQGAKHKEQMASESPKFRPWGPASRQTSVEEAEGKNGASTSNDFCVDHALTVTSGEAREGSSTTVHPPHSSRPTTLDGKVYGLHFSLLFAEEVTNASHGLGGAGEPLLTSSKGLTKEQLGQAQGAVTMDVDKVQFRASHESIKSGVRPLRRSGVDVTCEDGGKGKKKSKLLQDITNASSVDQANLKPNRVGPNEAGGLDNTTTGARQSNVCSFNVELGETSDGGPGGNLSTHFGPTVSRSSPMRLPDPNTSHFRGRSYRGSFIHYKLKGKWR